MHHRIDRQAYPLARLAVHVAVVCVLCLSFLGCHQWRLSRAARVSDVDCRQYGDQRPGAFPAVSFPHYSRCVDEHLATREAIRRANRSLKRCYSKRPSVDFVDGYRHAFIDVALGGDGDIPAVPPERYWATCYRTAAGHQLAQDWYAGYVAGSNRVISLGRYQFNTVASSGITGFDDHSETSRFWYPEPSTPFPVTSDTQPGW